MELLLFQRMMICNAVRDARDNFEPDELDLKLLEAMLEHPEVTFKQLAKSMKMDQRTISRRIRVMKNAGVMRLVTEIDWSKVGLNARAYVGSGTALGQKYVSRLVEFIKSDPRIVEAYETVGDNQYLMNVFETDISKLRETVLRDLEPITSDLVTSVATSEVKRRDFLPLLRHIMEMRFPGSKTRD